MATDIHSWRMNVYLCLIMGGIKHRDFFDQSTFQCRPQARKRENIALSFRPTTFSRRILIHQEQPDFLVGMLTFQTISLVVLLLVILPVCLSHPMRIRETGRQECRGCGEECDKCIYGITVSPLCGVLECRKGPNERCGGHNNMKGVCGEGMLCQCERCTGCSIDTLKCSDASFDEPCRTHGDAMTGFWDTQRGNWFTIVK